MTTEPHLHRPDMSARVHLDDNCDDCGRPMRLTGDALCPSCEAAERERELCIVCRGPKVFLEDETCSDACDAVLAEWPEP